MTDYIEKFLEENSLAYDTYFKIKELPDIYIIDQQEGLFRIKENEDKTILYASTSILFKMLQGKYTLEKIK